MKTLKFIPFLFVVLLFTSCGNGEESGNTQPSDSVATAPDFIILQLNDVYEIAPLEGGKVAGLARVATVRDNLMNECPDVITVLSGDFVSPSLIGTLKVDGKKIAGAQMVDVLNSLKLDYVTFGNHEFDLKEKELKARLNESEFLYTCTNAFHADSTGTIAPFTQNGTPVPSSVTHVISTDDGELKLGLVGVVLPFNQQSWVHYTDVDSSFIAESKKLNETCDIVVGITHLEMDQDVALAAKVDDIPLFIGGHDHTAMVADTNGTKITKADANAKTIYIHRFYQENDGSFRIESELMDVDESIEEDADVAMVVNKWTDIADKAMDNMGYQPDEVIYQASEPLDGRESSIRYGSTNLGTMIVESMLAADPEQQVAILNSGSVRLDDQLTGDVTQYDILRTLPFGGGVSWVQMKGSELEEVLEIGTTTNKGLGGYLQVAGATNVNGIWEVNGERLAPGATYKVIGPGFLMDGKEANLEMLGKLEKATADTMPNAVKNDVRDLLIAYMKSK